MGIRLRGQEPQVRITKLWKPIVVAALIAGTADLAYACIHIASYYGLSPQQIFQSIARGVLGASAMRGGWLTASLGIALEYLLTLIMASVYACTSIRITDLRRYWWLLGPCYGLVVMVVMYTLVLPLSAVHGSGALPDGPRGPDGKVADHQMLYATLLVHVFIIGLVISACARFLWPTQATPAPGR